MSTFSRVHEWTVAGLVLAAGLYAVPASAYTAPPYPTPQGIMLVDVSKVMDDAIPQFLWRRLGDASGNPLYTYDADQPGHSSCTGECAKEFPPLAADAHAQALGDFSIVERDDHVKQWAYQGKPLYRYSGKDPEGQPVGARFAVKEDPKWADPGSDMFSPKAGWRRAKFMPENSVQMPSTVELGDLAIAGGFGFVDATTRMTVYMAPVSHKLSDDWRPVRASALAQPTGEFTVITRSDDRTRQWAYRGEALYTYAADYAPGEANGIFTPDAEIHAALAYRNFAPPGVKVGHYLGRGPLMTDAKGLSLYYVSHYQLQYGGRETRDGHVITYNDAKAQGALACQGDCTASWKPLLASANDKGWGFWEVVKRPEGTLQWAFKGSPVYTFVGDKKPGDLEGNNRYVILYGAADGAFTYSNPGSSPNEPAAVQPRLGSVSMEIAAKGGSGADRRPGRDQPGAGFYWHTVGLFY